MTAKYLGNYASILLPNKDSTQYWVASRVVTMYTNYCDFVVQGITSGQFYSKSQCGSTGAEASIYHSIMPVVSLSTQQLQKATDGTYNVK